MRNLCALISIVWLTAAIPAGAQEQPRIEWQVVDRFRLFDAAPAADRERVDTLIDRLAPAVSAAAPVDLAARYADLLQTLGGDGAEGLRKSHWNVTSRQYDAGYLRPTSYTIRIRMTAAAVGATCRWTDIAGVEDFRPCSSWWTLVVPAVFDSGRLRGRTTVSLRTEDNVVTSHELLVEDRLIVAIGDSFIAGEGNPDVPARWSIEPSKATARPTWGSRNLSGQVKPAVWWDKDCNRSLLSFPVVAGLAHAARDPHAALTLVHLGCAGAEAKEGIYLPQKNLPGTGRDEKLTQLQQLDRLLGAVPGRRTVDTILLSIGGNDAGFVGVIRFLTLPTKYGPAVGADVIGLVGGAICPYKRENPPLRALCGGRDSAEARIDGGPNKPSLAQEYDKVQREFVRFGLSSASVLQTAYPDILSYQDADGVDRLCHTALNERDLAELGNTPRAAFERAYAAAYPGRVRAGFEAFNSVLPSILVHTPWFFQLRYDAEADGGPNGCDMTADPDDSEVCQAWWVWSRLNQAVKANAERGWKIVDAQVAKTAGHGWCVHKAGASLALPLSIRVNGAWRWTDASPEAFDPYDPDLGRWFRTANDSLLTQYLKRDRFIHGTIHPTFRAHIAYAEGIVDQLAAH